VARVSGRAEAAGRRTGAEVAWSLYLKVPNPTATHHDPWHREPFQREVLLYQSGILDDLPGGLVAPRCFAVVAQEEDEPWMWLEDVGGVPSVQWTVERFGLAARHLGLMQGALLAGRPLPSLPWLQTGHWLRERLARVSARVCDILRRFAEHPLTARLWHGDLGLGLRRLWDDREPFFEFLESAPRSLCHGDFNYTNLFAHRRADGTEETAAVDWQYAGLRQIGSDIAGLIADSSVIPVRRKAAEPEQFAPLVLDGYLAGLQEAGWKVHLDRARLACIATLALPWSFNLLGSLDAQVLFQPVTEGNRATLEAKLEEYIRRQRFLLDLAEEARELLQSVA
jgi:hypothetical protein